MRLDRRVGVRRVTFSGHQCYYEGYWHGWVIEQGGIVGAVIETEGGTIRMEPFIYGLTFIDPLEHLA